MKTIKAAVRLADAGNTAHFPMARNHIVEFGARNKIGIKTRYTVLPKYSNEFHKIEIRRDNEFPYQDELMHDNPGSFVLSP